MRPNRGFCHRFAQLLEQPLQRLLGALELLQVLGFAGNAPIEPGDRSVARGAIAFELCECALAARLHLAQCFQLAFDLVLLDLDPRQIGVDRVDMSGAVAIQVIEIGQQTVDPVRRLPAQQQLRAAGLADDVGRAQLPRQQFALRVESALGRRVVGLGFAHAALLRVGLGCDAAQLRLRFDDLAFGVFDRQALRALRLARTLDVPGRRLDLAADAAERLGILLEPGRRIVRSERRRRNQRQGQP